MLAFVFINHKTREQVEAAVESVLEQQDREVGVKRNRVYGAALTTTLIITVMLCEDLIEVFGTARNCGWTLRRLCNDILDVIAPVPFTVVFSVAVIMAVLNERNTTWRKVVKDTLMTWVVICFVAWIVGNVIVNLYWRIA